MNLPNKLTLSRLAFAVVIFGLLEWIRRLEIAADDSSLPLLSVIALVLFVIAAITDAVDGYIARKQNLATAFGRVADPLMDKIIISGMLVFFVSIPSTADLVPAWMVALILVREFLMTGLRGFIEGSGSGFGARIFGKLKMVLQCFMVCYTLFHIGFLADSDASRMIVSLFMWGTLIATLASGASYFQSALTVFRDAKDL